MRKRTLGRELALKFLFSRDVGASFNVEGFDDFAEDQERDVDARDFARILVEGVVEHKDALIVRIEESARNWTWRRMPAVDRNLLLIGTYEIDHEPDILSAVSINEIVDLAKRFSTETSGAFVNGVLDTLVKSVTSGDGKE